MRTWSLADLIDRHGGRIQTGPFGSQLHQHDYSEFGVPVVMPKDIVAGRVDESSVARIPDSKARQLSRHVLKAGDIVFPRRGDIGKCALIDEAQEGFLCGTGCLKIEIPKGFYSPRFLYYYLGLREAVEWLERNAVGTTMLNLNTSILGKVRIPDVDLLFQERIASILSAYDYLIENNWRRIQLLEQAARLLYKEWFVHLRFPGHEHVKIKDGVPEGWETKPLQDVVEFKEGPGLRNYQYRDQGIPFLNIRTFSDDEIDLSKTKCIDETEVMSKYQHFLLNEDDHVVSSSGTLGRVVTIRKCHLPVMLNTSLIRMRPKGIMRKWYLKAYLKYGNFIDQVTAMATGAAQLNYGPSHLKAMSILMPDTYLVDLFEEHVSASYTQIKFLLDGNLQLAKARDLLLPRLMNGEVAV